MSQASHNTEVYNDGSLERWEKSEQWFKEML